ncbi:hypothetical protein C1T31_06690 [Hanstruepera neustonica]|uniref:Uncharacterized protein n=1 Tax=Hanstruepera neustonica TaxID=1445657 RepID=A0A2K1E163_9FLAO|nr:hypothetical protein [Hanstruepera neustonica]PNQ74004.1 hypothetical protein C1T31_06690 [Hanstruepera neustonica]
MNKNLIKRNLILGILFLLPVFFVLILSLSKDNYNTLDIVKEGVVELPKNEANITLKDHITVLAFLGNKPMDNVIAASNLKELIYDKFKGFKKFQIVVLVNESARAEAQELFREIATYEDLRFWHFVYANDYEILSTFKGLNSDIELDENLATDHVFIIDTDLNQRGRLDDRTDNEIEKDKPIYGLFSYDCIEVAVLKNKMGSEDLRVLFTEYRQKRKGNFDSTTRRAEDLNRKDE